LIAGNESNECVFGEHDEYNYGSLTARLVEVYECFKTEQELTSKMKEINKHCTAKSLKEWTLMIQMSD